MPGSAAMSRPLCDICKKPGPPKWKPTKCGIYRCHPCRRIEPLRHDGVSGKRVCEHCRQRPVARRGASARFCSLRCFGLWQAERTRGDRPLTTKMRRADRSRRTPGLSEKMRRRLLYRWRAQGRRCTYCGGGCETVDHVVPLARGGTNYEGNLVPACRRCNSSKADRLLIEWRLGKPVGTTWTPRPWLTVELLRAGAAASEPLEVMSWQQLELVSAAA